MKKQMTIIVLSDDADRVHMALMMAATTAAMGRPVTLFFAKRGLFAVTQQGWANLTDSIGRTGAQVDARLNEGGVADFAILMDALASLDVTFTVCESALAEHGISRDNLLLRPCPEVTGLASLVETAAGGDWVTV